jgi:4-hydroxybenzoate polyprenyltransferase
VENEREYQKRLEDRKKQEIEQIKKEVMIKRKDSLATIMVVVSLSLLVIGISVGIYSLIQQHKLLGYFTSAIIIIQLLLMMIGVIFLIVNKRKNKAKEDKAVALIGVNLLILLFVGICIGLFFLIKSGTNLAFIISIFVIIGLIYLIFKLVRNKIKR